jgi:hypothetical protein
VLEVTGKIRCDGEVVARVSSSVLAGPEARRRLCSLAAPLAPPDLRTITQMRCKSQGPKLPPIPPVSRDFRASGLVLVLRRGRPVQVRDGARREGGFVEGKVLMDRCANIPIVDLTGTPFLVEIREPLGTRILTHHQRIHILARALGRSSGPSRDTAYIKHGKSERLTCAQAKQLAPLLRNATSVESVRWPRLKH